MILKVDFLDMIVSIDGMKDVPCICKVKGDKFIVEFVTTFDLSFQHIEGELNEWSLKALNDRAPSRAGGKYTYHEPGLISVKKADEKTYQVVSLKLFYNNLGWLPFIEAGKYATPVQFWDDEPDWLQ